MYPCLLGGILYLRLLPRLHQIDQIQITDSEVFLPEKDFLNSDARSDFYKNILNDFLMTFQISYNHSAERFFF